jgi:hypothetical protein
MSKIDFVCLVSSIFISILAAYGIAYYSTKGNIMDKPTICKTYKAIYPATENAIKSIQKYVKYSDAKVVCVVLDGVETIITHQEQKN